MFCHWHSGINSLKSLQFTITNGSRVAVRHQIIINVYLLQFFRLSKTSDELKETNLIRMNKTVIKADPLKYSKYVFTTVTCCFISFSLVSQLVWIINTIKDRCQLVKYTICFLLPSIKNNSWFVKKVGLKIHYLKK